MALGLKIRSAEAKKPVLEVIQGPGLGERHVLAQPVVYVGRSEENQIVLPIEGVSRKHLSFKQTEQGQWVAVDLGSKNGLLVNGERVESALLNHGDVIQVGPVLVRFQEEASALNEGGAEAFPAYGDEALAAKPKLNKRVLMYAGAGLILAMVYLFSGNSSETKKADAEKHEKIPTPQVPELASGKTQKPVGLEDPGLSRAQQETDKLPWGNSAAREAEQYFRRGQREYLNKNFLRAVDLFQAAVSLDKNHAMARQYLRLATYELQLEAKKNWEMAVKYFESLQYQRAIYHFSQVVMLYSLKPTDPIVSESEKYIAIAKKRLEAAEIFP